MRMDGHADVKKLIVTFHNFVNEPKKEHCSQSKTTIPSCLTTFATVFVLFCFVCSKDIDWLYLRGSDPAIMY